MIFKSIYLLLPYFIKFLIINVYSYYLKIHRYDTKFKKILKLYIENDYNDKFTFEKKIFYEQIKGNDHYQIQNNFNNYPIIDKKYIKDNYDTIINKNFVSQFLYTSGTTGSGFKFPVSKNFIHHQWAIFWKFRNLYNLNINSWCIYFVGQPILRFETKQNIFWIKSHLSNQLFMSQYHLNEDNIEFYLNKIYDSKINWIHAYPSTLNLLVNLAKKKEISHLAKYINKITCSSEKLFDYQRQNIESFFKCKVRDLYGLTEGVVNIFECEEGVYHIDESFSYVELIKINKSNEYKIIGTSYNNKAFPLVRYDTGDTCTLYETSFKCNCNRKSRTIKEILGRDEDYLLLESGTKIGRLDHLFKNIYEVIESQIYQNKPGYAIFRIVKGLNYNDLTEKKIIRQIKEKLGKNFKYKFEYLEKLPRTKNGKIKFVISDIYLKKKSYES